MFLERLSKRYVNCYGEETLGSNLIKLTRDVEVIMIPDGIKTELKAGEEVILHQSLGGTYTVGTEGGYLVRISGDDADAIGKEPERLEWDVEPGDQDGLEKAVWKTLKTVFDPEIPVNIVDLGLVYEMKLKPADEHEFEVRIEMTLTAPGCGMGPVLQGDVEHRVKRIPGVARANVEVVFDPPWDRDMMSEEARLELGMY